MLWSLRSRKPAGTQEDCTVGTREREFRALISGELPAILQCLINKIIDWTPHHHQTRDEPQFRFIWSWIIKQGEWFLSTLLSEKLISIHICKYDVALFNIMLWYDTVLSDCLVSALWGFDSICLLEERINPYLWWSRCDEHCSMVYRKLSTCIIVCLNNLINSL